MTEVKLTYSKLVQIARELALGALEGKWESVFLVGNSIAMSQYIANEIAIKYEEYDAGDLRNEAHGAMLDGIRRVLTLLCQLEFINYTPPSNSMPSFPSYSLTNKSFQLLNQSEDVNIFISYRRAESSLLALYLQSRLKIAGGEAFVDVNNLSLGDEWHSELQDKVQSSTYFICLIAPTTLQSEYVRKEIQWANATDVKMIPIFHNGFDASIEPNKSLISASEYLTKITQKHGHVIKDSGDPNDYRNAVDEILTSLGYVVL